MKVSVIVIAHNEEAHIDMCIESLLAQTQKPDEVLVVVHNSTDRTLEKVLQYPRVTALPYDGPQGIVSARIYGIDRASGDMILCIDGDATAQSRWVEKLAALLGKPGTVLAGSWVKFSGALLGEISNPFNGLVSNRTGSAAEIRLWGSSMAFWKKDAEHVKRFLAQSEIVSRELGLSRTPEDYWLALSMHRLGNIAVTNATYVTAHIKESSSLAFWNRYRENMRNGNALLSYFKKTQNHGIS